MEGYLVAQKGDRVLVAEGGPFCDARGVVVDEHRATGPSVTARDCTVVLDDGREHRFCADKLVVLQ